MVRRLLRDLLARPGFSIAAILTLALTIGSATAVFSLFDAVVLRPFPYAGTDRLVRLRTYRDALVSAPSDVSLTDFDDWRRVNRSFSSMAAFVTYGNNLTGDGPAQSVKMTFTTPELFDLLGVRAQIGRTFTERENELHGDVQKIVLGYALWQQLYAGRADVLGRTLQLRGQTYAVIGVMPPGFDYPQGTQVWVPLMARYSSYTDEWWRQRDARPHTVLARLRSGMTLEQARADMEAVTRTLAAEFPVTNRGMHALAIPFRVAETAEVRPYVTLVVAAVALLLIIGLVNVASLFVARAAARERELSIRLALGATVAMLARQLFAEGFVYALISAVLGAIMGAVAVRTLIALVPVTLPSWMMFRVDGRVIGFTAATMMIAAVLFSLVPLLYARRVDVADALKQGTKGTAGGRTTTARLRRALVVAEVALSLILLIGAALMLRSLANAARVKAGFATERLIVLNLGRFLANANRQEGLEGYANEYRRIRDRLATLPGVLRVSGADNVPFLEQPERRQPQEVYTRARATRDLAYSGPATGADVMPGFFATMGMRLVSGRDFAETDDIDHPYVAVLTRRAAATLFDQRPPLGEEVRWGNDPSSPWATVIGVVEDIKWNPAERDQPIGLYHSSRQFAYPRMNLLIRTSGPPAPLLAEARRTVGIVSHEVAVARVTTMESLAAESMWQRRVWGFVLAVFATLALTLAATGLYGVMSFHVAQHAKEMGIRIAVGAAPRQVIAIVMARGMRLVVIGGVIGLTAAAAAARLLSSLLFDVGPSDVFTYTAIPALLTVVAATACLIPALRAARAHPVIALQRE